jgi:hypothetical protein
MQKYSICRASYTNPTTLGKIQKQNVADKMDLSFKKLKGEQTKMFAPARESQGRL